MANNTIHCNGNGDGDDHHSQGVGLLCRLCKSQKFMHYIQHLRPKDTPCLLRIGGEEAKDKRANCEEVDER